MTMTNYNASNNTTSMSNATSASATNIRVYQTLESAKHQATIDPASIAAHRLIVARFRNPARVAACWIPAEAWAQLHDTIGNPTYRSLLDAVLETAAKSILSRRLENMSIWPTEISTSLFTPDAILTTAAGSNSEWLSKEELTAAWDNSATRKRFISNPNYANSPAYRAAVSNFRELIIKLAGKTSTYKESELDAMVSKLDPADLETELGAFILKRTEQIRNKPVVETASLDLL